jgi:hypothetical protein
MMTDVPKLVARGSNIPGPRLYDREVLRELNSLEKRLREQGHTWQDVSLLIIANSKDSGSRDGQLASDQDIIAALNRFCDYREWYPSLLGTTVFSSFYAGVGDDNPDINDGLLFIAVLSSTVKRISVAYEISEDNRKRKDAAVNVLRGCIKELQRQIEDDHGTRPSRLAISDSSLGILFTSGSGHVEALEFIDFTDCYAIGQELVDKFDNLKVVGGCSTNRGPDLSQCIYYSYVDDTGLKYGFSYNHCAAAALLPAGSTRLFLEHPYVMADAAPLQLTFHPMNRYAPGRYFYIQTINGQNPIDFLANYWGLSKDALHKMLDDHTSIPTEPKTFTHTISSAKSASERVVWPNVPIWFERGPDKSELLRLVRAEPHDSNYYLMVMAPRDGNVPHATSPDRERAALQAIEGNCTDLANYFDEEIGGPASTLSFICESRKVLLNDFGSNIEAESITSLLPPSVTKVGIYLNGEYSTGHSKSIGYHNFSQISAILPPHRPSELPY